MKVAVKFYERNRRFEIVSWKGDVLFTSGLHKNMENSVNHADKIIKKRKYDVYATTYG